MDTTHALCAELVQQHAQQGLSPADAAAAATEEMRDLGPDAKRRKTGGAGGEHTGDERQLESVFLPALLCALGEGGGEGGKLWRAGGRLWRRRRSKRAEGKKEGGKDADADDNPMYDESNIGDRIQVYWDREYKWCVGSKTWGARRGETSRCVVCRCVLCYRVVRSSVPPLSFSLPSILHSSHSPRPSRPPRFPRSPRPLPPPPPFPRSGTPGK